MSQSESKGYPTDLTDEQWGYVEPLLQRQERRGKQAEVNLREVVNGLLYQTRTGCQWRLIPNDFPDWWVIRYYFDKWRRDGTFQRLNESLRQQARCQIGRQPDPSAALIDSQSVKTTAAGGERGFDGGKKGQRAQTSYPDRHAGLSASGVGSPR